MPASLIEKKNIGSIAYHIGCYSKGVTSKFVILQTLTLPLSSNYFIIPHNYHFFVAVVALFFGQIQLGLTMFILVSRNGQNYMAIFLNHQGFWKKGQKEASHW